MPLIDVAKHIALDALGNVAPALSVLYVSLHTEQPSDLGSGEVSGGSPAYSRKSVSWANAAGGAKSITNQPLFNVPAGVTVRYVGIWSLGIGGVFLGYAPLSPKVFGIQGTYLLTGLAIRMDNA